MKVLIAILMSIPLSAVCQPLFTLLSPQKTGINFQNRIAENSTKNVLAYEYFYNGGGVAAGDLNNDGLADLVFTSNMDQPKVYFNKGNFVFDDVTGKSRIRASGWKTGVTLADVNADGWLDVYICRSGNEEESERANLLYINQKNGSFKEAAAEYGIDEKGYSTHAAFFDADNDGDLDLYVLNHPIKRYTRFDVAYMKAARDPFAGDKLFRNDNGKYTDITLRAGISGNPISFGLGVAVADFNNDGWTDIYVSNDYDEDDYLYINQKDGTFKDECARYFRHTSKFSMGSDVGDVNNDALPDLITLDMLPEDNRRQKLLKGPDGYDHFQMLLRNGYAHQYMRNMLHLGTEVNGHISYSEAGQLAGISNTDWSWSALFADYDLDGWQDLFITNGYLRDYTSLDFLKYDAPEVIRKAREAGKEPDLYDVVKKMPASDVKNYLFRNTGSLHFENVTRQWGMDQPSLSNGAAYADFDNDGDWDLVTNNVNQPAFIWQNNAESLKNHFVKIRFKGPAGNSFGIGTKVVLTVDGNVKQLQTLQLSRGFQSSVEPVLIFGLGKQTSADLEVIWPDGKSQKAESLTPDKEIVLEYNHAKSSTTNEIRSGWLTRVNDSLPYRHVENDYNDFKREPLLPHQYSRYGPALSKGDINGDGKEDFFVGGANGQPGVLFINEGDGKFIPKNNPIFFEHRFFEDVFSFFADLDGDKDQDLYVVSGGNEANFQDRVYWNDGQGNFKYFPNRLPETNSSGAAAVALDIDNDGDLDIFRGGHVATWAYPSAPQSYLMLNDKGVFKDATPEFLRKIGMISTVQAADLNNDGMTDLIIAGEYLPVTLLKGTGRHPYFDENNIERIQNSEGWWYSLLISDYDQDGDLDILAGNYGLNCQMKPTVTEPLTVDAFDIDNNKIIDAIISYYINGRSYPMPTRDELFEQVPSLKVKFPDYKSYADATVKDIFSKEQLEKAIHLEAREFRSGIFRNDNRKFSFIPFPHEAQSFPVRDMIVQDFDKDGVNDVLVVGNNYAVRAQTGKIDAGSGLMLKGNNQGLLLPVKGSGFLKEKDSRRIIIIDQTILVANNNEGMERFRIN